MGTGPANGPAKTLNNALLGGIGIGVGYELLRHIDFGKLLALAAELPPELVTTPPPERPKNFVLTLPPFHLNLPLTPIPITPNPSVGVDATAAWTPPPDAEWNLILRHPGVAYIVG
jgi:hypothetical protein